MSAEGDILFQNKDVCILKPDSERGVPIYHLSSNPNICIDKLYSYNGLRKAKPELRLKTMIHPRDPDHFNYIFFMPPYSKTGEKTFEDYHGKTPKKILSKKEYESMAIIKVDPEKTFVYFQMARSENNAENGNIINSRMRLSDFIEYTSHGKEVLEIAGVSNSLKKFFKQHPYFNTNGAWEVIVKTDFLDRSSYICVENNIPFVENSVQKMRTIPAGGDGSTDNPAAAGGGGGGGGGGGAAAPNFEPEYLKGYYIKCPGCSVIQNPAITPFNHEEGCPFFGQEANYDFSKSLAASKGGRRRSRRRLSRRRRRHTRR